jgi:monosaccharide ABC transporter membrane protein, CUT2 family (TC 3.A.1.2.-)
MFLRGIVFARTGGFPVKIVGHPLFREAMAGKFYKDFRVSIIWLAFLCIVFALILIRTRYGNWVFAVGGNKKTARDMGIKVTKVKLLNFMLCSVLGAFAGIMALSRFGAVGATTGIGWELEAIAAAVIGGCLLTGGFGSIIGAVMGAILISLIKHGLVLVGAPSYWYTAFIGVILIGAAVLHVMIRRWAEK